MPAQPAQEVSTNPAADPTVLASNLRPELASKMLGHSNVAFTLQTYVHPKDDELVEAVDVLQQAIGGTE